jgi:hypothetical protein
MNAVGRLHVQMLDVCGLYEDDIAYLRGRYAAALKFAAQLGPQHVVDLCPPDPPAFMPALGANWPDPNEGR